MAGTSSAASIMASWRASGLDHGIRRRSQFEAALTAGDPVLTENIAQVLIDFASALEVVHDRGYMHLDVKPENVLLSRATGASGSSILIFAQPIPESSNRTKFRTRPIWLRSSCKAASGPAWMFGAYGVSAYELLGR